MTALLQIALFRMSIFLLRVLFIPVLVTPAFITMSYYCMIAKSWSVLPEYLLFLYTTVEAEKKTN